MPSAISSSQTFAQTFLQNHILDYILVGLVLILIVWVVYLHLRLSRLLKGRDGASLEDAIVTSQKQLEHFQKFEEECLGYFTDVERRLHRSIQAVETERFNPFKGSGEGGTQSFSTALLSEKGDGVVISSLYSRDRISIFSKPLLKFKSTFDLTDEEKNVVEKAAVRLKK